MATHKRLKVENALARMGFRRRENHHAFFRYYSEAGEKTRSGRRHLTAAAARTSRKGSSGVWRPNAT